MTTQFSPYISSGLSLSRISRIMVIALLPCALFAIWNTGYQANSHMPLSTDSITSGWQGTFIQQLNINHNPKNHWSNFAIGALYFVPMFLIAVIVSGFWQRLFAYYRKKIVHEDFIVIPLLFILTLPPTVPLWQVAIGLSFGIVIGKEIFGGLGMNIVHPVLVGRVFLYFAYPEQISGQSIWTVVDGHTGATALTTLKANGLATLETLDLNWSAAFLGKMTGSLGETSVLACLAGGLFLLFYRVISWRIIIGILTGTFICTSFFNIVGSDTNFMFSTPWYWHWVLGGFAFGTLFLATDPVTASQTNTGRWLYGFLIGFLVIMLRVVNPTAPEGITFAILLANMIAPLIDHGVIQANIKRRQRYLKKTL